jgi:ribosomal protection tetracycline resistance protein
MRTLNLGILAHVDAGKTSLTERLLHAAGVIDEIGRVDDGNTQTDTLALERQRGITIRSAVVSFVVDDVAVNLIDTPGHPDFIAEVERVLDVLDGAVLVISAVEGVQAQTRILMRALQRLRVPTLIFVNKIDRAGADVDRTLDAIRRRLSAAIVPMASTLAVGTAGAEVVPFAGSDDGSTDGLAELLAENDETLLAAYLDGAALSSDRLRAELARQAHRGLVHPVLFGSAITGAGVEQLMAAMTTLLPAIEGDRDAPVSGSVFKVERGPAGEKLAYVRLYSGELHPRDRVRVRGEDQTVTGIAVFDHGPARRRSKRSSSRGSRRAGAPSTPPWPSSPSRIRSSTSARTNSATSSTCRSTARSRRASSRRRWPATTASTSTSGRPRPSASSDLSAWARRWRSVARG